MVMAHYTEGFCHSDDGTEIFFSLAGPGKETSEPDVVLCDGVACDGFVWKYLVPHLARRHRVIRFHYRGHGNSRLPKDMNRFAISDLVDDLFAAMDASRATGPSVLFGHSMGVQIILEAHRRSPGRVAALVPICGSYGNPLDTFHNGEFLKKSFPLMYGLFTGFPEAVMRLWHALLPSPFATIAAIIAGEVNRSLIRLEDLQPYFEHLARMNAEVFAKTLHHASVHSARDHLPRIDVPTLVIGAENDTFTPAWLSHELADHIPLAELLMVPRGSHAAALEQPDLMALRIEKFLGERLGCYTEEAWRSREKRTAKASASSPKTAKSLSRKPRTTTGKASPPKRATGT